MGVCLLLYARGVGEVGSFLGMDVRSRFMLRTQRKRYCVGTTPRSSARFQLRRRTEAVF